MAGDGVVVVGDRAGDALGLKLVRCSSSPLPFSCCKDVDAGLTTVSEDGAEPCGRNGGNP